MTAVKFIEEDGNWFIEGLIMPVGGPLNGNDLTGSHFPAKKDWDYAADWFPDGGRPGLYSHGFDDELGLSVIGREVKSWKDDKGVWLRGQIDKAHEYASEIKSLLDQGLLSLSSGAVDHLVKIAAKSGEIQVWPWVEWSLVPNPANPDAVVYQVKSTDAVAHLAVVGTDPPEAIKADVDTWLKSEEFADKIMAETTAADFGPQEQHVSLTLTSIKDAIASSLTPQALHDAAVASGAACKHSGDTPVEEPAPLLAVAGKSAEPETTVDLAALKARFRAEAIAVAKEQLGQ